MPLLPEYTLLKIFSPFPEKQSCREIFHCIENIFYQSGFLSNLRLPWKTELPWNFSLYWKYIFIIQGFWATYPWPKEQSHPEIFTVLNIYFLSFRIFEQLALALKTEFALKFFETGGAAAPPDSYACDHHHTPLPLTRGRSLSVVHVVFV